MPFWFETELTGINPQTLGVTRSFTKSNGTTMSRIYERLTRASRRRESSSETPYDWDRGYRAGVYEALNLLREELTSEHS